MNPGSLLTCRFQILVGAVSEIDVVYENRPREFVGAAAL